MYSEEQKQQVLAMLQADRSIKDIIEETGIGRSTIYRWIDEANEQVNYDELDDEWDTDEMFQEDVSQNTATLQDTPDQHEEDMQEQNYNEEEDSSENIPYKQDAHYDLSHSYLSQNDPSQKRPNSSPKVNETWRGYDQEVEKLRLQLEHQYKMEVLRQKSKALELEEQKLRNQEYELTIKEQQLLQQKQDQLQAALQDAKQKEETKRKLLQQVKKQVQYMQENSETQSWDQAALEDLYEQFVKLQEQIETVADTLEQDYENWQVWQSSAIIIEAIENAINQISRSFFKDAVELDWNQEEEMALQTLSSLYALDQPLEKSGSAKSKHIKL